MAKASFHQIKDAKFQEKGSVDEEISFTLIYLCREGGGLQIKKFNVY